MASLDVESLFTNVPLERSIEIILQCVYDNPNRPPPKIAKSTLEDLLKICTTEVPFNSIDGKTYLQRDGVAMGSPLGCTIANFYMCDLENRVLQSSLNKPLIYARYVDDIYVVVRDEDELEALKERLKGESILNLTKELSIKTSCLFWMF